MASLSKYRRMPFEDLDREARRDYGRKVIDEVRKRQLSELLRELGPTNPRSPCASGTWHSDGNEILKAIRVQNAR